jgi:hypothetical protein
VSFSKGGKTMKKVMLFLFCLAMMLLFSACHIHIDTDPWPASPQVTEDTPSASQESMVTISPIPAVEVTEIPTATDTPGIFTPIVTPTPEPNNEVVEPGFNG